MERSRLTVIGCVSRVVGHETIAKQGQSVVTRRPREWSSLRSTIPRSRHALAPERLWDRVIMPLVDREKGRDDVYGWLELVFQFCEGKPFVYYSQYVPSARIYALARSHKVRRDGALSVGCPPLSSSAIASGTSSG